MNEVASRLTEYYQFDSGVIEQVTDVAEHQRSFNDYSEMFDYAGVTAQSGSSILDISPRGDYDREKALLVHLSMANPLDTNVLFQVASVAMMFPDRRIVAAANPSGWGFKNNVLTSEKRRQVSKGNFFPVVENVVRYLESDGVEEVTQVGGSYGVDLALATTNADAFQVKKQLLVEPASVVSRSLIKLGSDFGSTDKALSRYVDATDIEIFKDARKDAVSIANYGLGLLRLTNIAVARGISKGNFESQLTRSLSDDRTYAPDTTVAWGSESELCEDIAIIDAVFNARTESRKDILKVRLDGQKHALKNDLHLFGALALTALK